MLFPSCSASLQEAAMGSRMVWVPVVSGPLAPYAAGFESWLGSRAYSASAAVAEPFPRIPRFRRGDRGYLPAGHQARQTDRHDPRHLAGLGQLIPRRHRSAALQHGPIISPARPATRSSCAGSRQPPQLPGGNSHCRSTHRAVRSLLGRDQNWTFCGHCRAQQTPCPRRVGGTRDGGTATNHAR